MKKKLVPLKKQLYILVLAFAVCIVLVALYSAYDYIQLQSATLDNSLEVFSTQLSQTTQKTYEEYESICYSIAYNKSVQDYLTETIPANKYIDYQNVLNLFTNTSNLKGSYIADIAVVGVTGNVVSLKGSLEAYRSLAVQLPQTHFAYSSLGLQDIGTGSYHLTAMPMFASGGSEYIGVMFLAVNPITFFSNDLLSNQEYEPEILFIDHHDNLVYGKDSLYQDFLRSGEESESFTMQSANNTSYAVKRFLIPAIDSELYVLFNRSTYIKQVYLLAGRQILGFLIALAAVCASLVFFYHPLIRSMNQLTGFMRWVAAGDRKESREGIVIEQGFFGCEEIDEISIALNHMLEETNRLNHTIFDSYTKMYELEMNNRKTEIAFLRSQVNPHFLYNTLTMICGLSSAGMSEQIISVTNALSQIFRYSIKGDDIVTLAEEMEIVRSYIMIQQTRFEDRFTVKYDLSDDSYQCLIPRMIIQPIVENAIVHGLEKSLKPGSLLIGAGRNVEQGILAIWIYDTGVGMPPEKLEILRRMVTESAKKRSGDVSLDLQNYDREDHDSIGLFNVNSRIVLYYGENYTLIIDSEEGVGTNIQIRVPYQTV